MYSGNGVVYNEEHSISFGDVSNQTFSASYNTWTDWHLIPSSRPSVAHPNPALKIIEVPGSDEPIDLTTFLTGNVNYGQRQGSWSFHVVNGFENWEAIRVKIVTAIHGKRFKVRLMDDPDYYYEGRLTVGSWESGAQMSSISINYQFNPYKTNISTGVQSL